MSSIRGVTVYRIHYVEELHGQSGPGPWQIREGKLKDGSFPDQFYFEFPTKSPPTNDADQADWKGAALAQVEEIGRLKAQLNDAESVRVPRRVVTAVIEQAEYLQGMSWNSDNKERLRALFSTVGQIKEALQKGREG